MADFHRAGGLGVVLRELKPLLHLDVGTIDGRTLDEVPCRALHVPGLADPPSVRSATRCSRADR